MGVIVKTKYVLNENEFQSFLNFCTSDNVWELSDKILYDLCKKYPANQINNEIIANVFLIGRSYAAAIERSGNKEKNPHFYEETVAETIKKDGLIIDNLIEKAKLSKCDDDILSLYIQVLKTFSEITKKNNISLASKYLHFHIPDLFFIYDSRAGNGINILLSFLSNTNRLKISQYKEYPETFEYGKFYFKCKTCIEIIERKFGRKLTPRQVDRILLEIDANSKK